MNKKVLETLDDDSADGDKRRVAILVLALLYANGGKMRQTELLSAMDRLWIPMVNRLDAIRYLEQHGHAERAILGGYQAVTMTP